MGLLSQLLRKKSIAHILSDAESKKEHFGMNRSLGLMDLTALGIAAIVGAGIFSTIGNAAAAGGPAVSLLFVFTAIACGFSALCYAEFAASIPISGSAYTYAYAGFGELVAWIIGWDLIMEYAVGNIAVAISWSGYFTGLLAGLGIHFPEYLSIDYLSAVRGYQQAAEQLAEGSTITHLPFALQEAWLAVTHAPTLFGFKIIADLPAFAIVVLISWLVYVGIRESKTAGNIMVLLKLVVLVLVVATGAFYVDPAHWHPFAPNGIPGVLKGVSGVFFAYIGFDAISTTAEECRNPQRDLPRSMILSLLITTVLYVVLSLVLTGMVSYTELGVDDPLAFVFTKLNLPGLSGVIAFSAVVAMGSVLLVFQVGQPRIWMSMSRDGLLPPKFAEIHPKYRTPWFATLVAGVIVAVPALFMNLTEVTDLTSIGTLFAFVLVSGGVLKLNPFGEKRNKGFTVYYLNSRYYLLPVWAVVLYFVGTDFINIRQLSWPFVLFVIISVVVTIYAVVKKWSLIPVLGLVTNLWLMSQLGATNWFRFIIWLLVGLVIYLAYGVRKSKLKVVG